MVLIALDWANGKSFLEISKTASLMEGTIVRTIRRLDELLRQLTLAARAIGNAELGEKFEACSAKIKRGIIFAASLYL